jgi:hypothetical protein
MRIRYVPCGRVMFNLYYIVTFCSHHMTEFWTEFRQSSWQTFVCAWLIKCQTFWNIPRQTSVSGISHERLLFQAYHMPNFCFRHTPWQTSVSGISRDRILFQAYHVTDSALSYFSPKQTGTMNVMRLQSCWEITNHGLVNIGQYTHTCSHRVHVGVDWK